MKKLFIALIFVLSAFVVMPIHADDKVNEVKITIVDASTANVELDINLRDKSSVNFLTGFELTFPVKITGKVTGKINKDSVNVTTSTKDNKTTLRFSTGSLTVDLAKDTWLALNFKVKGIVKSGFGAEYLYLPALESNFGLTSLKYTVKYPTEFKKLSFISAPNPQTVSDNEVTFNLDKGLLAIWGDSVTFNLKMAYSLKNSESEAKTFLINLPSNLNQDVSYNQFPTVNGGLYDEFGNNFAVRNVNANDAVDINLEAATTLTADPENHVVAVPKYNWNFNQGEDFSKTLIEKVNAASDSSAKIDTINDYLVEKLTPFSDEKIDLKSVNNIWNKLSGSSKFNSFEYCYVAISAAEAIGYTGSISYGYMVLPDMLLAKQRSPHVWCEINDGTKNYFIDPFLEDEFKIDYNFNQPLDRVTFGTWYPGMEYNNIMGLNLSDSQDLKIELAEYAKDQSGNNKVDISLTPSSDNLTSGDYYTADLVLKNQSNYFLALKDITIDDRSYLVALGIRNFYPALIPAKETLFSFNNLIETNILYGGSKTLVTKIEVDNSNFQQESLQGNQNVTFNISVLNILKQIAVIAGIIVVAVMLYRFVVHKKLKKLIRK